MFATAAGTIFRFVGQKTAILENFLARAQREIPGFKFESTGFVPYPKVAEHLADARVGMIPTRNQWGRIVRLWPRRWNMWRWVCRRFPRREKHSEFF